MNKAFTTILLLLVFTCFTNIYAIEPKNDDEDTELSPIEKNVKEILEKTKKEDYDEEKLIAELVKVGEQAVPILLRDLYNKDCKIISLAASALNEISKEKALPELVKAYTKLTEKEAELDSSDRYVYDEDLSDCGFKIFSLIVDYEDKAVPFIQKEIEKQSKSEYVRNYLISMIMSIDTKKAFDVIKEYYKKETSIIIKLNILSDFLYEKDEKNQKEYQEYVHKLLDDKDLDTKCAAIEVVGIIKDKSQTDKLIKWSNDEKFQIRFASIYALGKIGTNKAVDAVVKQLKHECETTRSVAANSLSTVHSRNKEIEKKIISALIETLNDKNSDVRWTVILVLGTFRDLSIIPHLEKVAENDKIEENRKEAKESVERIKKNKKEWDEMMDDDYDDDDWGEEEKGWNSDE